MINASLLALGRVINQLVDKTESSKKQHIAYRYGFSYPIPPPNRR
jgi:hypothetical protein